MKIYFLSSRPCALLLNGAYFGLTDSFERFAEVSPKDRLLAEFIPENAAPLRFFITENLRFEPPEGCEVYLVKDGIAVFAKDFPPNDFSLQPLLQKSYPDCLITLFKQGRVQLSIERDGQLFVATLPPCFQPFEIHQESRCVVIDGKTEIAVYDDSANLLIHEKVTSFELTAGELKAVLPLSDRLRRTAECVWELTQGKAVKKSFVLRQENAEKPENVWNELLPYAFLESILLGTEYSDMLSDELAQKGEHIRGFLGEFTSVVLTPDPHELGLVRQKAERLFEVCYARFTVQDGKITDVQM